MSRARRAAEALPVPFWQVVHRRQPPVSAAAAVVYRPGRDEAVVLFRQEQAGAATLWQRDQVQAAADWPDGRGQAQGLAGMSREVHLPRAEAAAAPQRLRYQQERSLPSDPAHWLMPGLRRRAPGQARAAEVCRGPEWPAPGDDRPGCRVAIGAVRHPSVGGDLRCQENLAGAAQRGEVQAAVLQRWRRLVRLPV